MTAETEYGSFSMIPEQQTVMVPGVRSVTATDYNPADGDVTDEQEARQAIAKFFNALSRGRTDAAQAQLDTMATFLGQGTPGQVKDFFLTACEAAASIENNRKNDEIARGYAVKAPLKTQLKAFIPHS